MITVAIVDDHPIVIQGLEKILSGHPTIILRGTYRDADSLFKGMKKQCPDVLIMDLQLPDASGAELAKSVKEQFHELKILVLTNMDQVFTVRSLFAQGVDGYLLKGTDNYTLIDAIKAVFNGEKFLDPILTEGVLRSLDKKDETRMELTQREHQVLELLAQEMTNKQIAEAINISVKSVELCKTDLFIKFSVKNSTGLVRKGILMGLIS